MYCGKCGTKNNEGTKFCVKCGALLQDEGNGFEEQGSKTINLSFSFKEIKISKFAKIIAILNIVLGAILFISSFDSDFEWTLAPFALGAGLCVVGILQILNKQEKVISIIQIVSGGLSAAMSLDLVFDWEFIGFAGGAGLVVVGILKLINKPVRTISILQIVFGGVSILLGFMCIDYVWGDTGIFFGAAFLVEGILTLVNENKNNIQS